MATHEPAGAAFTHRRRRGLCGRGRPVGHG
jgi:hypothetical protein